MSSVPLGDILKLKPKERLELVEAIWDSLAADPSSVPVPSSHKLELKRSNARNEANPSETVPWNQVKESTRKKLAD